MTGGFRDGHRFGAFCKGRRLVGEKRAGSWRLARWPVHRYLEEHGPGRPRVSRLSDAPGRTESDRDWVDRVNTLEQLSKWLKRSDSADDLDLRYISGESPVSRMKA